jgi:hypothetical protein
MKISQLLKKNDAFDDGEWVELSEFTPHRDLHGLKVRLRPSDHPKYRSAYNAGLQPHMKLVRLNKLSQDVYDRVSYVAMAKQLIMDVEGFTDDAGAPIAFDRELVVGWANLETYPDMIYRFFAAVSDAATFLASTGTEERAELGKS